jgi:hypothetical protein
MRSPIFERFGLNLQFDYWKPEAKGDSGLVSGSISHKISSS